jgi:hypothetical protein
VDVRIPYQIRHMVTESFGTVEGTIELSLHHTQILKRALIGARQKEAMPLRALSAVETIEQTFRSLTCDKT